MRDLINQQGKPQWTKPLQGHNNQHKTYGIDKRSPEFLIFKYLKKIIQSYKVGQTWIQGKEIRKTEYQSKYHRQKQKYGKQY